MSLLSTYKLSQGGPSSEDMKGRTISAIWKYASYIINDVNATPEKKAWAEGALTQASNYANVIWPLALQDVNFAAAMLEYSAGDDVGGDTLWQPIVEAKLAEVWNSSWGG